MKQIYTTLILLLLAAFALAVTAPVVTNVTMVQRTDGSKLVDISYDLSDAENDNCTISILVSTDGGSSYTITPTAANLSGDIGAGITVGIGKHIIWNIGAESYTIDLSTYRAKVLAEDGTLDMPANFVLIEGGTYLSNIGGVYFTITSFYMDKYETTQATYQAVMGVNPSYFPTVVDGPVEQVSWFKAIEFCNRRSIMEGLSPCYSYSSYGTNPDSWPAGWNSSDANHINVSCDWAVNGYRLPTRGEWFLAAYGGVSGTYRSYSGSSSMEVVGWYQGNAGGTTHTVGTKLANQAGTYDQSGNVIEWVWDIVGATYTAGTYINPRGAASGTNRYGFGAAFNTTNVSPTYHCRLSVPTGGNLPTAAAKFIGFRCVRNVP
jgi:formylglycine-generating enzyme required for sulfatase activity